MVLKKSNSCLNSGATQRIMGGCAKVKNTSIQPGTITISLDGHYILSVEDKSKFQEALDEIYNFLDWQGPDLSSFYDSTGNPKEQVLFNRFIYTKSKEKGCISLVDNVKEMIISNVLEPIAETVEVNVKIYKYLLQNTSRGNILHLSWTSTTKNDKHLDTKKKRKLERRKKQQTRHGRGVQRQYRLSPSREDEPPPTAPLRKIYIDIQEPHGIDARLVHRVNRSDRKTIKPTHACSVKSCWKNKGFVNGLRSCLKGYNYDMLKLDELEALHDASKEENENLQDESDLKCHLSLEDFARETELSYVADSTSCSLLRNKICLGDYIMPPGRERVEKCVSETRKLNMTPVNSASSIKVVKHPKGSCVFLNETKEPYCNDIDSGFQSSSSDLSDESLTEKQEQEDPIVDNQKGYNLHLDLSSDIMDFFSRFIQIQLILPSALRNKCLKFHSERDLHINEKYPVGDCDISFGNCYPHTFIVTINSEKEMYRHSCFLTGRVFEVSQEESWAWQVQIGNGNICDEDMWVEEKFLSIMETKLCTQMTLQHLVEMFQESVSLDYSNQNHINVTPNPSISCSQVEQSPWLSLKHLVHDFAETVSVKEALTLLNTSLCPSTEPPRDNAKVMPADDPKCSSVQAGDTADRSSPTVCDICFFPCDFSKAGDSQALALTPCGHVFCAHCWSSHVYIGLGTGDPIRCMAVGCKQEVNNAVLRSLAPGHMVNKWYQRIQHKDIERNPRCKWCPNTRCDKVAVVKELSTKINQFGTLVLCECGSQWCFSCQTEPHWPASCQQMAAFRKLLAKTGNNLDVPASKIDFAIQLKPCPKCRYPIEKNDGCPSMVCRMCWFNFCWNCLRTVDHSVYACRPQTNNFVTYHLENKLAHNLPFRFFPEFLQMNKKGKDLSTSFIHYHNQRSQLFKRTISRFSFSVSVQQTDADSAKQKAITLINTCAHFVQEVYTLLESYYVVLSFVSMNKRKVRSEINHILHNSACLADRLQFIAWRLDERVLRKNLSQILKHADTATVLLQSGQNQIVNLKDGICCLRAMSKNIDTISVGNINPKNYMRYL